MARGRMAIVSVERQYNANLWTLKVIWKNDMLGTSSKALALVKIIFEEIAY